MWRTLAIVLLLCLLVLSCSRVARQPVPVERSGSARGVLNLGIQHYNEKRYNQAIAEYQKVLSDFPGSNHAAEAQFRIANVYHWGMKEPEEALVAYQTVVDNYPDSEFAQTALVRIGSIYHWDIEKPEPHKAIEYYQRMLSQAPHSEYAPEALYWTGEAYMWTIEDVDKALLQIAKQHRDSKEYDKAIETYREVVSRFPDSYSAAIALGSIARYYSERGECDRAIAELKTIIEKYPFDDRKAGAQYRMGMYYRRAGRYIEAIEALQKGMETYPDSPSFSHEQCQRLIAQCKKELDADGAKTFAAFISDTPVAAQATRQIDVLGARALSDAFKILERELDCVITYEEPSWEAPLVREMFEGGPVVPKKQRLTFQYSLEDPEVVIQKVLDQYHQQTDIARFELVVSSQGMYNVFPIKYTNKAGELVEYHSILSANISLSMQDVTHSEIMDEILRRLPQKLTPGRIFPGHYVKTSVSWDNKSARSCINQVFHEFNQLYEYKRSWHIRRGPASKDRPAIFSYHRIYNRRWHMKIEAARPLAEALKILERNHKRTITYEDTLYSRSYDVMRNRAKEPQMPRGGIVDFSYSPDVPGSASRAVQNCLASYNTSSNNPGVFTMGHTVDERHGYIIHVFPDKSRYGEGEQDILVPYTPILSTIISISEQGKTPLDILRTICAKAVESSGTQINVGEFAQEVPPDLLISYGVNDKPARVALTQFLKSIDKYLSWQLLYDPKSKEYVLNVHSITTE